jgi:hypothetical protein
MLNTYLQTTDEKTKPERDAESNKKFQCAKLAHIEARVALA